MFDRREQSGYGKGRSGRPSLFVGGSQKQPCGVHVLMKDRPLLSVPVIIRAPPMSVTVAFHPRPFAAVPLIIVVLPIWWLF